MIDDRQLESRRPIQRLIRYHRIRARKHQRTAAHFCPTDWRTACEFFGGLCAYCQADEPLTMDHFIPLTADGSSSTVWNIVPACKTCNDQKRDRNPYRWLRKRFGLARAAEIAQRIERYFEQAETYSGKAC